MTTTARNHGTQPRHATTLGLLFLSALLSFAPSCDAELELSSSNLPITEGEEELAFPNEATQPATAPLESGPLPPPDPPLAAELAPRTHAESIERMVVFLKSEQNYLVARIRAMGPPVHVQGTLPEFTGQGMHQIGSVPIEVIEVLCGTLEGPKQAILLYMSGVSSAPPELTTGTEYLAILQTGPKGYFLHSSLGLLPRTETGSYLSGGTLYSKQTIGDMCQ